MEERVARLEANVEHMRSYISDTKIGIRRLNDKIDAVDQKLTTKIDAVDQKLTTKIDAVNEKLSVKIDRVIRAIAELKIGRALVAFGGC